jgi:hypothetical protein
MLYQRPFQTNQLVEEKIKHLKQEAGQNLEPTLSLEIKRRRLLELMKGST